MSDGGPVTFEYHPDFGGLGLDVSPLHLPLERRGEVSFPELSRLPVFMGLPGVFADSLPDQFGILVMGHYFWRRGRREDVMRPLSRLLYVGDRAMGALEFYSPFDLGEEIEEVLAIQTLVQQARTVIDGDATAAIPAMMRAGSSAGGARPKACVLWNRYTNRLRSGFAQPDHGDESWLIKFDGVDRDPAWPQVPALHEPGPWGRIEFAYSRLARRAGIDMAECHLLEDGELAHFMTRRFDRVDPEESKLHFHTLGGIQHIDFHDQYTFDYEGYLDTIRFLGLGQSAVNEGFRRMVFNLAAVNLDDHVKNFGFLMDSHGNWQLAPAYDVTFSKDEAWTRQHQMSANGKFLHHGRADLLRVGRAYDVPEDGDAVIDQVTDALDHWPEYAAAAGVSGRMTKRLKGRFNRFR